MSKTSSDERWMQLALTLGRRGLGQVWPNPAVGCIIVKNNRIVGRGWTQPGGRPHAEVMALAQAGNSAQGATAFVTLEPCAHTGKTGPCAHALADAGIKRVVSATTDPDKRVAGKGHQILRAAGVELVEDVLKEQALEAHLGFFTKIRQGRPMVTLKLATSLDGRIATRSGRSKWITGPQSRRAVHLMRATHDAILVGRQTVQADDPSLTVRDLGLAQRSPVRVVLDSQLRLPATVALAQTANQVPTWVCTAKTHSTANAEQWRSRGASLLVCPTQDGRIDMTEALISLADQGITRLMVEGGGSIAASLMKADLVDRLIVFTGGVAIGGDGLPGLASLGLENLTEAPKFTLLEAKPSGADTVSSWARTR